MLGVCVSVCVSVYPPSRDCRRVAVSTAKVMRSIQCCVVFPVMFVIRLNRTLYMRSTISSLTPTMRSASVLSLATINTAISRRWLSLIVPIRVSDIILSHAIGNNNKDQSNLAIGSIAANWGFRPPISPSRGRLGPLSNRVLLGTTQVSLPNGISFSPTALVQVCQTTRHAIIHTYIHTYIQTDGQTIL